MKYAQLIIGLLAGTALGGSVVAATGNSIGGGKAMNEDQIRQIVRKTISDEPQLLIESVQKYQQQMQEKHAANASDALKDAAVREQVFHDKNAAHFGPKDSAHTLVEFFDYNCGACKFMFKTVQELAAKDKQLHVVFHEYPIFGPQSDTNAKIGIAVNRLYPEKYFDFHVKMMGSEGHTNEAQALEMAKSLGMDEKKIKAESVKPDVMAVIDANRKLGEKLGIQGTPTLVIGNEVIGHALSPEDVEARFAKGEGK